VKTKRKVFSDLELAEMAEEALRKAVAKAAAEYRLAGQSMVIVRGNKIVHIPPDQIKIEEVKHEYVLSGKKKSFPSKAGKRRNP